MAPAGSLATSIVRSRRVNEFNLCAGVSTRLWPSRAPLGPVGHACHMDETREPPDEAYGRVTAPERFSVLHEAADELLSDLVERYDVGTSAADVSDFRWRGGAELARAIRLRPSRADAASLVCGFTAFPGLVVRFGKWHVQTLPHCGCDACDEDPGDLIQELHRDVTALVKGRFREELSRGFRPRVSAEFVSADGSWTHGSARPLERSTARDLGAPGAHDWSPWPARASR